MHPRKLLTKVNGTIRDFCFLIQTVSSAHGKVSRKPNATRQFNVLIKPNISADIPSTLNKLRMAFLNDRSLKNKSFVINYMISDCKSDLAFLTETWKSPANSVSSKQQLHYITCHLADTFIQSDLQLIRLSRRHTLWGSGRSKPCAMLGVSVFVLVCFGFDKLWRKFVILLSRSLVYVFVCHARSKCDVVTLREFPGLAGFPSPPSFK